MLSAVERLLTKDDIVIADGLNYIKGFRYQLYCIARAIGTPHCVVSGAVVVLKLSQHRPI
jgi:protein KTI12